jgi:hypothetical protein
MARLVDYVGLLGLDDELVPFTPPSAAEVNDGLYCVVGCCENGECVRCDVVRCGVGRILECAVWCILGVW